MIRAAANREAIFIAQTRLFDVDVHIAHAAHNVVGTIGRQNDVGRAEAILSGGRQRMGVDQPFARRQSVDAIGAVGSGKAADDATVGTDPHDGRHVYRLTGSRQHPSGKAPEKVKEILIGVENREPGRVVGGQRQSTGRGAGDVRAHHRTGHGVLQAECVPDFVNQAGKEDFREAGPRTATGGQVIRQDHLRAENGHGAITRVRPRDGAAEANHPGWKLGEDDFARWGGARQGRVALIHRNPTGPTCIP